ncbi:ATP-binding cassette subfamily G member 4-like [Schistocerca cancellata]|uniref:ATP-binding cassette subfamily G member 4-like n=1 Tax=Schistocerca cancellata TaxID=274614 RepID=UPI002117F813|nr:ATP-binding cassette subfamily G member 4-like [Schistocerca cancellata]
MAQLAAGSESERELAPRRPTMATLNTLATKAPVDVDFRDITYVAGKTTILQGVTGRFSSGQLTAIMGSSGAGKSSLMDILTGNRLRGVSGSVLVNGKPRNLQSFRRVSCYVMQEDILQPNLKLIEAMMVAARLKLDPDLTEHQRRAVVDEVLTALGLSHCSGTFTDKLSGGERKRFSIAQELVNNPSVIFIDEPTTGLDHQASSLCVRLLKQLAHQGCTIICSIHQPGAAVLKQFDQLYVMTTGRCAYQGATNRLLPFLDAVGFECPVHYNPADYVIEILHDSSKETIDQLVNRVKNGKCLITDPEAKSSCSFSSQELSLTESQEDWTEKKLSTKCTPFFVQFSVLWKRTTIQIMRSKVTLLFLLAAYVSGGLATGLAFFQIGNNGEKPLAHFNFMATTLVTASYGQILAPTMMYPSEVTLVKRECKNGWYSLNSYVFAVTTARLPFMHGVAVVYVFFSYFLAGQPLELDRFLWYTLLFLIVSVVSESYGLFFGSIFRPQMGAIIAPAFVSPLLVLWQYNMGAYHTTPLFMRIIMSTSFFRLGMIAMILALMEDRKQMDCPEIFCPFSYPKTLLGLVGADGQDMTVNIGGLLAMILVVRVMWYIALRIRLSSDLYSTCCNYVYKLKKR